MDAAMRTVIAILILIAAAVSLFGLYRMKETMDSEDRKLDDMRSAYTTADYRADMRCDICFDDIGDEKVSECRCGKVYHLSCAEPTGSCPYCGTPFEEFLPPREPRHITCPRCGNFMSGNICACGTVIPDSDGTFECACGERILASENICRRCGRMYGRQIANVKKHYIPHQ